METRKNFYAEIPFAAAQIDSESNLIAPNSALCELLGVSNKGCCLRDILAVEQDEEWLTTSISVSQSASSVVMLKKATGCLFMGTVTTTRAPDNPSQRIIWIDASNHLEQTNASLKNFFDQAPQALIVCHPVTAKIMRLNNAAALLFGIDLEDKNSWGSLDDLLKTSTRKTIYDKLRKDKSLDDMRMMIKDAHQSRIPVSVSARLIEIGGGNCVLIGIMSGLGKITGETLATRKEYVQASTAEPLLNATPIPLIAATLGTGKIARLNHPASQLFQVSRDEVEEGKGLLDHFFTKESVRSLLDTVRLEGSIANKPLKGKSHAGSEFICYASANRAEIDGIDYAIIGLNDAPPPDTSDYQDFFDQAPIPMLLAERSSSAQVKRLNRRAQELFLNEDNQDPRNLHLKHLMGLRTFNKFKTKLDSSGFVDDFEITLSTPYDEQIACLLSCHTVFVNGREHILLGINDITERKESEQTLERFFNAAPIPMILSRINPSHVLRINQRAAELFCIPADIGPRNNYALNDFIGRKETEDFFNKILSSGFVEDYEINFKTPNGQEIWAVLSGQLINVEGEDCIMTGVNDITQRKNVETALKASREQAVQATRAKSAFLSTMSHEIRTPMTGVLGMLELLHMTEMNDEQNAAVSVVKDSATALLTIIDDILDFSKIESGRLKLENIPFNIRTLVESSVELMGAKARSKGLELIYTIDKDIPLGVKGDPTRLRQILLNLIGNAIKFTPEGSIIIRACSVLNSKGTAYIRFEVADEGIGISQEKLRLLFKPFSQTDASTSRHFGGTGLGLSICKALTELMKGQISVISEEGAGSTFWLELGLEECEVETDNSSYSLDGLNFLVIQHHPEMQKAFFDTLTANGANVCVTGSVDDAIEKCLNDVPDFAIIDHKHHKFDGFEIISKLQALTNLTPGKIILTTSDISDEISFDASKLGLGGRLYKPITQAALLRQASVLSGRTIETSKTDMNAKRKQMSREQAIETNKLVLFVEDNSTNQLVVGRQLARLGYVFDIANHGIEALDLMSKNKYALVITDCRMPEMNGLELSLNIRKNEMMAKVQNRIPIIALTANATAEDADACLSAGMNEYMVKPLTFVKLAEAMEKWLPLPKAETENRLNKQSTLDGSEELTAVSPIDLDKLGEILGLDDREMFEEILGFYVETLDELMGELNEAIEQQDNEAISDRAHAAKGASRNAAANQLGDIFEYLEKNAFTMKAEDIEKTHQNIHQNIAGIKEYVANLGS